MAEKPTVFLGEVEEERRGAFLCSSCHSVSGCMTDMGLHRPSIDADPCAACGTEDKSRWYCFGFRYVQTPAQAQMRRDKS